MGAPPTKPPVLIVGASGFLGAAMVRAAVAGSRPVRGLVRGKPSAEMVRSLGGTPILGDVLELESVVRACEGCAAIIHVASRASDGSGDEEVFRRTRVNGARNLVRAAQLASVRRLVIGSGYWVYRGSPGFLTEESAVEPSGESASNYSAEQVALAESASTGPEVVVVRPGMVYGDGSWFRGVVDAIRAGTYRIIGSGGNRWSFVDLDDAGRGFLIAADRGAAGQTYNLVDGTPAPWGEFARFVAARLDRPVPESVSMEQATSEMGAVIAKHLASDRAASSARLRALGWTPRFECYTEGVSELLRRM